MQLILRVTNRCNFKCDFCSASELSQRSDLPIEKAIEMIQHYRPDSVMLEGGDPLVCKPSYIKAILDYIDKEETINELGITTNLWDFWKRPEKWVDIFKHPKVSVCTSFQYGNKRKLNDQVIFDAQLFEKVYSKFVHLVGKRINFIAVLDEDNEQYVYDTVNLAKRLNIYCKINPAFASGRCDHNYSYYKAIEHYTNIILNGDGDVVDNCYTLMRVVMNQNIDKSCPHIRHCSDVFRIVSPDEVVTNCSIFGMSFEQIKLDKQLKWIDKERKEIDVIDNFPTLVSEKCLSCRCFDICNGCRIKIEEIRNMQNLNQHCDVIKSCYDKIKRYIEETNEI